jgi:hypothetical protein
MMRVSLLDTVPSEMSKRAARIRLEALREQLSEKLAKTSPNMTTVLSIAADVKRITAEIAECRELLGPPQYIPREFNAKPGRRGDTQSLAPVATGGHFVAHEGKRL